MSEKETGENLVEQVEQKQDETPKEEKEFDAQAFMGKETPNEKIEETKEEPKEEVKEGVEAEKKEETSEEDVDEDGFNWGEVEKKEEEVVKEDDDWDSSKKEVVKEEETNSPAEIDWAALGDELGIKAKDKEGFKSEISKAMTENVRPNDTITTLQGYLKMSDKELVLADLVASGLTKEEASDTLLRIKDSGLLKREALNARKQLNAYITQERSKLSKEQEQKKTEKDDYARNERKRLQSYLKEKDDFFGGKVKKSEKKELYDYIVSGDFANEVYSNHANVADAAFLWRYKEKIFKMLRGQGMETGKAAILDKITNPDLGRKTGRVEIRENSGFDATEFMK